ncbi:MAG TPA: glutaredoxin 3 [Candidatus Sulfotelmatobacter sp.]|nr:glutaredoxin 3 [Candidatus Sulfotelmatobacter sp.]
MAEVTLYTTMMCPYCYRAKQLLEDKGVAYTEIDVGMDADKRAEMTERSGGRRTVPQIFVDGAHIGGSDDLYALERAGKLDALLAGG